MVSKKTNAAKQKKAAKKRVRVRPRVALKKGRKNPATRKDYNAALPGIFGDPIFLHHVVGALLRYMELMHALPTNPALPTQFASPFPPPPPDVDAEFPPATPEPGPGTEGT